MTFFISEVASNHNANFERALRFVDVSAELGFDAVKFQVFKVSDLFSREVLSGSEEHRNRAKWQLPQEWVPELSKRSKKNGIGFSITPFSLDAVWDSAPYVDFFKVASYELLWDSLLIELGQTRKPVVLSTGMAELSEIRRAVDVLGNSGCPEISVLHCLSAYPAPISEANLAAIDTLRKEFRVKVGWSDHTASRAVIHRAISRWGASIVEMHFDLDGEGFEFGPGHCWLPEAAAAVISEVRMGINSDGDGIKSPRKSEQADRDWRADPSDGLRPLKHMRSLLGDKGS